MPRTLEYQFEVEVYGSPKKFEGIVIPEGRMPYDTALDLADKLGRRGIHYTITEIDLKCNNQRQLTSRLLHRNVSHYNL